MSQQVATRGWSRAALTGAMIAGVFGLAWAQWGASGLTGGASVAVRIVGAVLGIGIFVASLRLKRSIPTEAGESAGDSMFRSASYRIIVLLEVIALAGGGFALHATHHAGYTSAWFAFVVGVHFLVFGRQFWPGFYLIGAGMIVGAVAAALVGRGGTGVEAIAGLVSAVCLLGGSGYRVLRSLGAASGRG